MARSGRRRTACLVATTLVAACQLVWGQSTFRTESDLVRVQAVVRDRSGRFLPGLTKADFEILDNGVSVEISTFTDDPGPLAVIILIDRSGSMAPYATVRTAVSAFVNSLEPADRVSLHHLGGLDVPFTTDRAKALTGLAEMQADTGSPIWSGVRRAFTAVAAELGRRVVVAFTDAMDDSGLPPPPDFRDRIISTDIALSVIGFGPLLNARVNDVQLSSFQASAERVQDALRSLTNASGGALITTSTNSDIEAAFRTLAEELRHQYSLGFSPTTKDGRVHKLATRVRLPGAIVKARDSYRQALAGKDKP